MMRFESYKIVINGNDEDDILYEQWYHSSQRSQANKPRNLDEMERNLRIRYRFSPVDILKDMMYERRVMQKLSAINQYRTGRLVLAASLELAADLYILRPGFRDLMTDGFGGDIIDRAMLTICRGATPKAKPATPLRPNSRVLYMPILAGRCDESDQNASDDSTLLHELVHAVRPLNFNNLKDQPTNDQWTDLEEFFAVMIQNIYMSERGDKKVRGSHETADKKIPATKIASAEFMANKINYFRVKDALKREPLAQKIAKLDDIPFNPFAEFERAKRDLRSI